jgi:hypothetical protein
MPTFRRVVPRRKAIEITRLLRRADGQKAAGDLIMEVRKEMEASGEVSAGAAKALKDLEFQSNAVWFHLTELWDYASPEERREGEAP